MANFHFYLCFFYYIIAFMDINKKVLYERLMILFAGIVQVIGFVISITAEDFSKSYVPYFEFIVPVANIFCATVCFFLVFFPKFRLLQSIVLFVQGVVMTLNSLIFLGVFLYCFGVVLLFCYGYLKSKRNLKIGVCMAFLLVSFLPILIQNKFIFFMAVAYSFFILFSYFHLYFIIRGNLFKLFPFLANRISDVKLPEPGGTLNLACYGLSERQINLVKNYKKGNANYKHLADNLKTSESTIKQEMSKICKFLGVRNSDVLLLLLQQYEME